VSVSNQGIAAMFGKVRGKKVRHNVKGSPIRTFPLREGDRGVERDQNPGPR